MAKNRYGKMQGNMQYNRPSGGYQKNLYRQQLKTEGVKMPKALDPKKLRIALIAAAVCMVVLLVVLTIFFKWKGLLIGLLIGLAAAGGIFLFLQHKQKEMIVYYKKIGMTEQMYVNELKKRNTDVKQIDAYTKLWRKTKAESIFEDPKSKKKNK